jgi:hypothetical protein
LDIELTPHQKVMLAELAASDPYLPIIMAARRRRLGALPNAWDALLFAGAFGATAARCDGPGRFVFRVETPVQAEELTREFLHTFPASWAVSAECSL